ncbi:hypothetical protein ACWU37_16670 [Photobacterium damselae subsp. damselae]
MNTMKKNNDLESSDKTISDRLIALKKGRTNRETASDWEIPLSTLTGYINRGSMLPADTAISIAQKENVSISWLIHGIANEVDPVQHTKPNIEESRPEQAPIERVCSILGQEHTEELLEALIKHGVSGVMFSERTRKTAMIIDALPDDAAKEIFELAAEAQYCSLVGLPFKPTRKDPSVYKKASNQN